MALYIEAYLAKYELERRPNHEALQTQTRSEDRDWPDLLGKKRLDVTDNVGQGDAAGSREERGKGLPSHHLLQVSDATASKNDGIHLAGWARPQRGEQLLLRRQC